MSGTADQLHRFLLQDGAVRGVLVQMEHAWQEVASRADYPSAIRNLLGQSLAASAMLTGNIAFHGELSLQFKSDGNLRLLFAQCSDAGAVRGLAQWKDGADDSLDLSRQTAALFAINIDHADRSQRQQGMVPVEYAHLSQILETYFAQSEQIPTRVVLACSEQRCAALMLQRVDGAETQGVETDPDLWNRIQHLTATLSADELLSLSAPVLLNRLYHDEGLRLQDPRPLQFGCHCSRERVAAVLQSLGRTEAMAAAQQDGRVEVICEFCNSQYHFDAIDLEQLFLGVSVPEGSHTTH